MYDRYQFRTAADRFSRYSLDLDNRTQEIRQHFEMLSDEALLRVNRAELTDLALTCYEEEMLRRDLQETAASPAAADPEAEPTPESHGEDFVVLTTFPDVEEARLAKGLLDIAEIPARLSVDPINVGFIHLYVPREFEDQAHEILEQGTISDEELAAQAEAAGITEPEPASDDEDQGR